MKILKTWMAAGGMAALFLLGFGTPADASNYDLDVSSITASSNQPGYSPAQASDNIYNNASNKWAAATTPTSGSPQWLNFDLGSATYVGAIDIYPEPGYGPKDFIIETSLDGSAYTGQKTASLTADKRTFWGWTPVKARYVRIKATSGFGNAMQIREAYIFSDILPHRVSKLTAGDLYDFSAQTEAGFDALRQANVQLVHPVIVGYSPYFKSALMPNAGDPADDANYSWTKADEMIQRFGDRGIDMFIGFNLGQLDTTWPEINVPVIDENGVSFTGPVFSNPYVEATSELKNTFYAKAAAHFNDNPLVRLFGLTGPGYFGGQELYGGSIHKPSLHVYDTHAKARFREWLQTKYASLTDLNDAWGASYGGWDDVQPPLPQRTGMPGAYDNRQNWSDLMFWLRNYLVEFTEKNAQALREATDKPLYVNVDGNHMFSPMESQASIGLIARTVSQFKPFVMASSAADESFGPAAVAAAGRFYGMDTAMDNANYETKKLSDDTMFSLMAKGIGTFTNSNMAEDFFGDGWTGIPETTGWDPYATYQGTEEMRQFAQKSGRLLAVDPLPEQADIAVYNSFYSSNYRQGYRYDDHMNIFDKDHGIGFNVRPFASWSHYLDTPDLIDDFLIEDGALGGYKLLVTANSSLTLTSDVARANLLDWINEGGAMVGFGKDSFNYSLSMSTRAITGGTSVSDWMLGLSGGDTATTTTSRTAIVAANKPSWLTSLQSGETVSFTVSDSSQAQAFTSMLSGAVPVLVDGNGNTIMAEYSYGAGKVLFTTIPVSDSEMFYDEFMGKILQDFAASAGAVRKIEYDNTRFHAAYMGTNKLDDSKFVVVADPQYMANGQYRSMGLKGDPQYMANGQTLSLRMHASLNGSVVKVDLTAPWSYASTGMIEEVASDPPQRRITFTADDSKPLVVHAQPYGSLPIVKVTAGMEEKPYTATRVADSLKEDSGFWRGGSASASSPQTVTADLGDAYPVSGMELVPYADDDSNELFSFESGRYDGWTVIGSAFGTAPSSGTHGGAVTGIRGKYWADSGWGTDAATGSLRSPTFTIDKEMLSFRVAGYDGASGTSEDNRIMVRQALNDAVLFSIKPPQSDAMHAVRLEVGAYIGTEVYIEVADGSASTSSGWLGIDAIALSSYKESKEIGDWTFERGDYAGWTVTGSAFGAAPSTGDHDGLVKGWRGDYWADSKAGGDAATGILTSPVFRPGKELLAFRLAGFDGGTGDSNLNFVYLRRASDDAILFTAKPPQSDSFVDVTWDVTPYRGTEVYLQAVDGNFGSSYGWLGLDHISYRGNHGFERGTYEGWQATGTGFGTAPAYQKTDTVPADWGKKLIYVPGYDGKYFASTHLNGNNATGVLTSPRFVIDKPILSFKGAGYDGPGGTNNQNYYWLVRASDDMPLIVGKPPQDSRFVPYYWDVSAYIGTEVYLKVEDNIGSGDNSGWIAIDDLTLMNNFDFEIATWVGWTTTGTAFGEWPEIRQPSASVDGFRGSRYATSRTGGVEDTGTLKSDEFMLENGKLSFRMAGYDGPSGTSDENFYYLKRSSDDAVLISGKPPQSDIFTTATWDVSAYAGTKVYFEIVDGSTNSWLAADDINWRGAGPRSFTVELSTDGIAWSAPVLAVAEQGGKTESYNWTPANARYVRLNIAEGYASHVAIKELTFLQTPEPIAIVAAAASSAAPGYEAGKAADGVTESDANMWAPVGDAPAWLSFDLGSVREVRAVQVLARNNTLGQKLGPRDFSIRVSEDGVIWKTVYKAVNNGENDMTYSFPAVTVRYVKLDIERGWNGTSQIREVTIWP